jgi:hypothetical protein
LGFSLQKHSPRQSVKESLTEIGPLRAFSFAPFLTIEYYFTLTGFDGHRQSVCEKMPDGTILGYISSPKGPLWLQNDIKDLGIVLRLGPLRTDSRQQKEECDEQHQCR